MSNIILSSKEYSKLLDEKYELTNKVKDLEYKLSKYENINPGNIKVQLKMDINIKENPDIYGLRYTYGPVATVVSEPIDIPEIKETLEIKGMEILGNVNSMLVRELNDYKDSMRPKVTKFLIYLANKLPKKCGYFFL